jgi:hypothetical protein
LIAYKGLWAATAKKDEDGITSDNYTEITSLNFVIYMLFQTLSIRGLVIRSSSTPSMRSFLTVFLRQDVSLRNPWVDRKRDAQRIDEEMPFPAFHVLVRIVAADPG